MVKDFQSYVLMYYLMFVIFVIKFLRVHYTVKNFICYILMS